MNLLDASAEQRQHFETIFKRAASDTSFRRRLLDQPKKAFQESTGVRLPYTYSIQFIETPKGVSYHPLLSPTSRSQPRRNGTETAAGTKRRATVPAAPGSTSNLGSPLVRRANTIPSARMNRHAAVLIAMPENSPTE